VEFEIHHVWSLRDGLFARMDAYLDEDEAREAAGLAG
jgi:ketosteroid isomerase-like protein